MSSPAEPSFVLIRRLADGAIEWIPLEGSAQGFPVVPSADYTLVDRADYEAPDALVAHRRGADLVVDVQGTEVLVLRGFFTEVGAAFYPTTNVASGAGPFSGSPLTPQSPVLAGSPAGHQVVWSAGDDDRAGTATPGASEPVGSGTEKAATTAAVGGGGGSSPLVWVGLAAGGLGLAGLAGGGGGGSSSAGGGGTPIVDTIPPQITSGATAPAMAENSGAGQVAYTVTATDAGTVTYSIRAGGDAGAFTINPNTGAVTLTGNPNFETKSTYNFTVAATDAANNSAERAVTLAINNRDEVAPAITSGASATAINENSGSGQVVYTVTSTDTGDISTGNTTYSLKAGGDAAAFTINPNTGAVTLTGNPDFEAKASYAFTVVATDAAGNSAERAVSLAINDLNESGSPIAITSGATAGAIDENSGSQHLVYTVTTTATGAVVYSLKAGGDAAAFTINPNTGAVTLTGNPDFETKPSYTFTVVATDAASSSAEQAVSLAINNRDEVAPTITSGATAAAINENSGSGQLVYTVTSTDTGDISAGSTTYSLKAGGDAAAFTINPNTGAVTLTVDPDFEAKPSYNFTVVATDAASNSAERAVSLGINNRDEVAPTITSGASATALNENSGAGQVIYTVTSTDTGDISAGSTSYGLKAGDDAAAFTIDANTGAVTLTANPDDETTSSYNFTVVATDAAGNSSERAVSLEINDLDEVAPSITSGTNATAIDENSGAGQVVYTVTSTDSDDISTGNTTYSLKVGGDAAAFTINPNTGAVTLTADPDYETKSIYDFTVVATDAANNSAERAVSLAINNLNDTGSPITITSGATAGAIDENSGPLQLVYTVTATAASAVTYSLKAGGDAAAFSIDPNTGAVTLTGNPDYEPKPSYNFTVVATDALSNSTEQVVGLAINNLDEVAPTITSGATANAIDENSGSGQVVYTVTSTDAGDISTGNTLYSLKAGGDAAAFAIDANTGAVALIGNPDHETKPNYDFTVVATDAAGHSSELAVALGINDLDEVAPSITSPATATAINENIASGQVVYTVTSTDTGDISAGSTTYSLKAGGDAAAFTINAGTGAVALTGIPDHETKSSYNFTVVATDAAGHSSELAVALGVNDLDEVAPTITSPATATAINENAGLLRLVYTVTSTDTGDISTGSTSYSLKAVGDAAAFTIDAITGAVRLIGNPNFEVKSSYSFTVVATDTAGNSAERAVTLAVNNRDEVAPTITSPATATTINENSGSGQVVYTVTSTDTGDISTGSTTYSLKASVGDEAAFTINASTGAVTLTASPDHETKPSYNFTVVATDAAGHSSELAVALGVNDLDEVAPTITSGATAAALNENSGSGQVVYTVTSTDTGDISTGNTLYSLKAGGDAAAFTIDANTGAVALIGNPDHETKSSYNFTVVATDAAGHSNELAVALGVNDLDEVAPTITSGTTATAINENSGPNQVVYTVTSTDTGDISTGSTTYSLKAGGDAAAFTINGSTGAVRLTGNPNFETKSSYNFTVVATDAASHSAERAVSLAINNRDEVAPTITSPATATAINENSGAGQIVYTVTSTDTGDISTGSTLYSLKSGVGDEAAFAINASTGAVTLTGNPDHETKGSYNFTVVATDAAGLFNERAVSLAINDLDDIAPTITSGATATAINENSGAGQVVYTVTSTDSADISTGSTTYGLKAGGDAAAFTINASTGAVTLTANPDDETKGNYSFTVVATDVAGNSSELAVALGINDLDEVAPSITSPATATAINENSGAGQVVYTVTSTDTGDISTGSTVYSLKAGGDAAAFTINASTGAVTLTANPDHETKSSYNFTVVATDAAGHSSELAVALGVNDLDEVAPSITSGATATAINENSGPNQVVYTVTSTDTGDISTGSTTYSLKVVGDVAAFTINANTGAVRLIGNPDFETKSSYNFTVVATDAASNRAERAVSLAINNRDEVAPTITSPATATAINENSGAGQVVYTVTSTDTGDISTGSTTYSLKAGGDAAAFTINAISGAVTLTANPDDETKGSYSFTVVATDAAGNSSELAVALDINDLDEVAPTITSGATATAINENSGAGQVVYTVTSTDTGDISTGSTTYSLKAGGDAAAFTIDANTGAVRLTGNPNFETKSSYNFTVVATDAASNSAERAVSLAINNRDEVAPTITSPATATAINENSGAGQIVYTVTSTDTGDISTGSTLYSLKSGVGDEAAFTINASTGAVTLTGNPDHETKGSYNFTVVATDAAGLFNERAVSLAINDLDDIAPTITSGATATAINENSGAGQVVYTVTSTDTGDISTGSTAYSLKAGGDAAAFTINASTGAVTLTANPDDETKGNYNFTVVATDAASNSAEQAVSLAINDLDEVAPAITSGATAADLAENSGSGQIVYTVTSTDTGDISTGNTLYSLKAVDDVAAFSINASTGAVTLTGDPDFEAQPSYNFTVVATDAALNSSEQSVSLAIIDDGSALSIVGFAFAGIPFGLVQDSSADNGRMFQSASDEIDIRVAVDDPSAGSGSDVWRGSANFGSDVRAALVTDGADVLDRSALANQLSLTDAADWDASPGFDAAQSIVDVLIDGAGGETNINSFADMPAVFLTSQGLA